MLILLYLWEKILQLQTTFRNAQNRGKNLRKPTRQKPVFSQAQENLGGWLAEFDSIKKYSFLPNPLAWWVRKRFSLFFLANIRYTRDSKQRLDTHWCIRGLKRYKIINQELDQPINFTKIERGGGGGGNVFPYRDLGTDDGVQLGRVRFFPRDSLHCPKGNQFSAI